MEESLDDMTDPMSSGKDRVVLCRGSSTLGPLSRSLEADLRGSTVSDGVMMTTFLPLPGLFKGPAVFSFSGRISPKLRARALA